MVEDVLYSLQEATPELMKARGLGHELTHEQYANAMQEKAQFAKCMEDKIPQPSADPGTLKSIPLMRAGREKPNYRHDYKRCVLNILMITNYANMTTRVSPKEGGSGLQGFGYKLGFVSALADLPWLNVPSKGAFNHYPLIEPTNRSHESPTVTNRVSLETKNGFPSISARLVGEVRIHCPPSASEC